MGSFWPELSAAYPDALVLLSTRDPESWWRSAHETIFSTSQGLKGTDWYAMVDEMFRSRFTDKLEDRDACIAAFEKHNARVRAEVPANRLLEWTATDGWAPICEALGLAAPDAPFPRINTREDFQFRSQQTQ